MATFSQMNLPQISGQNCEPLNVMWSPKLDPGTERDTSRKIDEIQIKSVSLVESDVRVLILSCDRHTMVV